MAECWPPQLPSHDGEPDGEPDVESDVARLIERIRASQVAGEIPRSGLVMNAKLKELNRHLEAQRPTKVTLRRKTRTANH